MLTAQKMVDLLNNALKTDPSVISALFGVRRTCNKAMADHPHVSVHAKTEEGPFYLKVIGLLNGMLLAAGSSELVAAIEDDAANGNVIGFQVVAKGDVGL